MTVNSVTPSQILAPILKAVNAVDEEQDIVLAKKVLQLFEDKKSLFYKKVHLMRKGIEGELLHLMHEPPTHLIIKDGKTIILKMIKSDISAQVKYFNLTDEDLSKIEEIYEKAPYWMQYERVSALLEQKKFSTVKKKKISQVKS